MRDAFSHYEDFRVGLEGLTPGRTIGEADIVSFASIVGDYQPAHLDRQFAKEVYSYGERISHGWLAMSLVPGMLSYRFPHIVGRGIPEAFLSKVEINYRRGLLLGSTIKVRWRVSEKADDPMQDGFGLVKTTFEIIDEGKTVINDGSLVLKVPKQAAGDAKLQLRTKVPWEIDRVLPDPDPEKVYSLEDYAEGQGQRIGGRTITEADVVNFVGLTGDFNRLYIDSEFAKQSTFEERVAPGMLIASMISGLWVRDGFYIQARKPPTAVAGHLSDGCHFLLPVKIGDTIHFQWKVASTRVSKSKPDRGIFKVDRQILNQRNEVVQEGYTVYMVGTRPVK